MSELDAPTLALGFVAGGLAGAVYLALLWVAVGRLAGARRPVPTLLTGMVLRLALLLAAFYLLSAGDPFRLVAALAGFIAIRIVVTRLVGRTASAAEPVRG
jgi:F1F0 ATPase subunit 2